MKLHLCLKLSKIWKFSKIHFYSILITVSMNFSNQLVMVTYDSDMEGLVL